jgi:hypothetical protein
MIPTVFVALLALLMVMAVTWLVILSWLFGRLRTRHPSTYESIGSPSIFWNNSVRNNWLLWKFLWSSHSRKVDDSAIARIIYVMRIFFVCYIIVFIGLAIAFINL